MLRYGPGDYNRLHQDIYGEVAFPFQFLCVLSRREEYEGGEFLLVEQAPRAQSKGTAIVLGRGEGLIFTTRERPVEGKARPLPGQHAPRDEPRDRRQAGGARRDLPRRRLTHAPRGDGNYPRQM